MNNCTNRNVLKRKSITCNNICIRTCNNCCTNLKTLRSNDIALYAVFILNKSNMSWTVWIVFDCFNLCRNIEFLSFEIDNTIFSSVSATTMTNSNSSVRVTAWFFAERFKQRSFRSNFWEGRIICNRHISSWRSSRLIILYCHNYFSFPDNFAMRWHSSYLIIRNILIFAILFI